MSSILKFNDGKTRMAVMPADVPLVNKIRAEICDEYIADGNPMPEKNWLYRRLITEIFRNTPVQSALRNLIDSVPHLEGDDNLTEVIEAAELALGNIRKAEGATREQERQNLLARADRIEADMQLQKDTADHWNRIHPDEEPIVMDYSDIEQMIAKMREGLVVNK